MTVALPTIGERPSRSWLRLVLLPIAAATAIGAILGGLLGWVEYACDED